MIPELDVLLLRDFAIALFIGALVGMDREQRGQKGPQFGGLRTFMLIALAGATSTWLGPILGIPWLVAVTLIGLVALLGASYWISNAHRDSPGMTGEIAAVVVFLLGAVTMAGSPEVAVVIAIATSAILAFKTPLHGFAKAIAPEDMEAALKLLFATFIVLPLLPDEPLDPWETLNPYRLWWLVVLISGLALLGYVAVRLLGERRGQALTGLFGGLVSSTAVTLSSARQSRAGGTGPDALALAVLLAWAVMFVRVVIEVAIVNASLLTTVLPPMVAMAAVAGAACGWLAFRGTPGGEGPPDVPLRNPFSLWEAVKFGLLFAVVLVGVEFGRRFLDEGWLYAIAALAGATDVDAITLSMAELAKGELEGRVACTAIVVATASNTVVKFGMVAALGSRALAIRVGLATLAIAGAGGLALLFT